jgi:outer membrane protein TolC
MKFLILLIIFSANISVAQNYLDLKDSNKGLNDLIESALNNNSRLEPTEFQKTAESTKTGQFDKQPAPMLDFTVDMIPTNLENSPRYTTVFAQKLILPGKLEERGLLGDINAKEQDVIKSKIQIELINQVKENYFNLYLNERMMEFNSEFQSIISNIITSQEISYVVGKGKQYQILKSNNELQKLVLEQIKLEENKKILINNLSIFANEKLSENFKTRNVYLLTRIMPIQLDSIELLKQMRKYNPVYRMIDVKIEKNRIEKNIAGYERTPDIIFKTIKDVQNKIVQIKSTLEKIKYIKEVLIPQTDQTFLSNLGSYESASEDFSNLLDTYRNLRKVNQLLAEMETMYLIRLSELEFIIGNQIFTIN